MPHLDNNAQNNAATQPSLHPVALQIHNKIDGMLADLKDFKPSRYKDRARFDLQNLATHGSWEQIKEFLVHHQQDPEYCKSILYVALIHVKNNTPLHHNKNATLHADFTSFLIKGELTADQFIHGMGKPIGFFASHRMQNSIERLNFIEAQIEDLNATLAAMGNS